MMDELRGELERELGVEGIRWLAQHRLGLDPDAVSGSTAAEAAQSLVEQCVLLDAVEALADAISVARPASLRRLDEVRRRGLRARESVGAGTTLGRYTTFALLGASSDATVFRARDGERVVRVKLMREPTRNRRPALNRYFAVTRAAGDLTRRWLPTGLSAGPIGDRWAIVQDFFDGEPLSARAFEPMRLADAWPILRRVLTGLAALHEHDLVHGALHPGNLLVAREGDPPPIVLLDAGAHHLRGESLLGGLGRGTVSRHVVDWAAPEQLLGELPTARSDVYAFGLLLHFLLAGELPVPAKASDLVARRLGADPESLGFLAPPGRVPGELDEIALRLLDRDPAGRPPDASAVFELLASIVSTQSLTPSTLPDANIDDEIERLLATPDDEAVAGALEASIDGGADPRRVADAFFLAADQLEPSHASRRRLLVRAGAMLENLAADVAGAERAYRKVIAANPRDEGAWTALERVVRRSGSREQLVDLLIERRDGSESHSDRARVLGRLGRVLAAVDADHSEAIVAFSEAVAEDPDDAGLADELEALAERNRETWREVLERLSRAAGVETDAVRRAALLLRIGHWHESMLGRADLALACYQAIVGLDPAHDEALGRIAEIYRRAQHWSELARTLSARAATAATPAQSRDLETEAAAVLFEQAGAEASARDILERVLADDPTHEEAGRLLAEVHLRSGRPREWVRVMEQRVDVASFDDKRRLLAELARGYRAELSDLNGSITTWERLLEDQPSDLEALRELETAYRQAGLPAKAQAVLERQLEIALTPRQRVSLLEQIAEIAGTDLMDDAARADALRRILELDPDNDGVLARASEVERRLRRWSELGDLLDRRIELANDLEARVLLLLDLARLAETQLGDPRRALAAYESVLPLDPTNRTALDRAAVLRAELGDSGSAADALDALADQEQAPNVRAEAWLRAADARRREGDDEAALERYRRALEEVPGHVRAASELALGLVRRDEVSAAVTTLEHALPRVEHGRDKAELGAVLARILFDAKKDTGRARAAANLALDHDPTNTKAQFIAGEVDLATEQIELAIKHLDSAAAHVDRLDDADGVRLLTALVEALAKADRREDARRRLELMAERFGKRRDGAEAAARLAFELEESQRALTLNERLLEAHERTLGITELAEAFHRRGALLLRLGKVDDAVAAFERAAQSDRLAVEPLRALARVQAERHERDALGKTLERILARIEPGDDAELVIEVGDLAASELGDTDAAARAYLTALSARPDDRKALLRLLRLYSDAEDWGRLVEVVVKLAGLTPDLHEKARYLETAARVTDQQLGDAKQALGLYDAALKLDPGSESVVTRALELRTKLGDLAGIRQILETQIARASREKDRERAYRLATRLADLDLGELNSETAIAVNEAALRLISRDPERENVLSELYMTDPKRYFRSAAELQRSLVARDPHQPEPYRRLRELGLAASRRDTAWCACQALVALEAASVSEEAMCREHRGASPIASTSRITDQEWSTLLAHPDAEATLTQLLMQVHPVIVGAFKGSALEGFEVDERKAFDPKGAEGTLVRALEGAAELLRLPLPHLFERTEQKALLTLGRGARPHLFLSPVGAHKLLPPGKAAFLAASTLVLLRPGYALGMLLPAADLKACVLGAIRTVVPGLAVPPELAEKTQKTRDLLARQLPAPIKARLAGLVEAILAAGGRADLTRWISGVDMTADRAGLLYANDLASALSVVRAAGSSLLSLSAEERTKALLRYAVSSEYLRLRNRLRVSIDWSDVEELEPGELSPIEAPR